MFKPPRINRTVVRCNRLGSPWIREREDVDFDEAGVRVEDSIDDAGFLSQPKV